jgi:hypothetical protein
LAQVEFTKQEAANVAITLQLICTFTEQRSQLPRAWLRLPKHGSSSGLDAKENKDCF